MGVLIKSGSGLMGKATAERGVAVAAVVAEVISEGNVAEMGVASLPSFGLLAAGMLAMLSGSCGPEILVPCAAGEGEIEVRTK